jgi:hypothetical protein
VALEFSAAPPPSLLLPKALLVSLLAFSVAGV